MRVELERVCDEVLEQWERAKVSLKMCLWLGGIGKLLLTQLKATGGRNLSWDSDIVISPEQNTRN